MRDAYVIYATDVVISLNELDDMPRGLVETYMLLKEVAQIAVEGGTLKL